MQLFPAFVPDLTPELQYRAVRSGGKGGQNVNKVSSKVELRFDLRGSEILRPHQKQLITQYLKNRINREGEVVLTCDSKRTQLANKRRVTLRFYTLLEAALRPRVGRVKTKPTRASKEKRLKRKKLHGQKKKDRKPPKDY